MSWIKFFTWLSGLYALYYIANILWDLLRAGRRDGGQDGSPELHFKEAPAPVKVMADEPKDKKAAAPVLQKEPAISAIGGVALKDLFNLAKAEVIAYNRAVTF